ARRTSRGRPRAGGSGSAGSLVDARLLDQPADLGEVVPVLAAVAPPPLDAPHLELAAARELAVDVRDLELAAARRLERLDDLEHGRRVAVEADDGVARGWGGEARVDDAGLLDDVGHAAVAVVRDDAEVLRVGDVLDEDEGAAIPARDRVGLRV